MYKVNVVQYTKKRYGDGKEYTDSETITGTVSDNEMLMSLMGVITEVFGNNIEITISTKTTEEE